jgi:hypothetical protein
MSLYLPRAVHDAVNGAYPSMRHAAFDERKIHDIVMDGIEAALRQRRYPSMGCLRAGTPLMASAFARSVRQR